MLLFCVCGWGVLVLIKVLERYSSTKHMLATPLIINKNYYVLNLLCCGIVKFIFVILVWNKCVTNGLKDIYQVTT